MDLSVDIYPVAVGPHPDTEISAGAVAGIVARQINRPLSAKARAWPLVYLRRVSFVSDARIGEPKTPAGAGLLVEADLEEYALEAARKVDIGVPRRRPDV